MTTLTKREATAVADALVLWRRRARTPQMLSDAEIDRLIERCLEGPHTKRWETLRIASGEGGGTTEGRVDAATREGWEIVAAFPTLVGEALYLRRELEDV